MRVPGEAIIKSEVALLLWIRLLWPQSSSVGTYDFD